MSSHLVETFEDEKLVEKIKKAITFYFEATYPTGGYVRGRETYGFY